MSKRIPVYLSEAELTVAIEALSNQEDLSDTPKGWNELMERLEEQLATFEE